MPPKRATNPVEQREARKHPASSKNDHKSTPFPANSDDDSILSFPPPSNLGRQVQGRDGARDSPSSASTNGLGEGSLYSTPGTSAAVTPAPGFNPVKRRGRLATTNSESTLAVNPVARAAALRDSQFNLNSSKRKRVADSEEDEDVDEDDSPDAQLARALQVQEDAAANSMGMDVDDTDEYVSRRTPRPASRKIFPKTSYVVDADEDEGEDDDDEDSPDFTLRASKRPKIELGSKGSNAITFTDKGKGKAKVIQDSEEEDSGDENFEYQNSGDENFEDYNDFFEIDDSGQDSEADIPLSTLRKRVSPASKAPRKTASLPRRARSSAVGRNQSKSSAGLVASDDDVYSDHSHSASALDSDEVDSDASDDATAVAGPSARPRARAPRSGAAARGATDRPEDGNSSADGSTKRGRRRRNERKRLESHHPELITMWDDLENLPKAEENPIEQPANISRELKPFQLQGVGWMIEMEKTDWAGGLLGDEMGMGKTIQAVTLIMSDFPAKQPSLVLIPPVAIMQWQSEIKDYTDGTLKTFVFHGTNPAVKSMTYQKLLKYDVILMSYNSLESLYRKQEKGTTRTGKLVKQESIIHKIRFHRVILDEAHSIKSRNSGSAQACFALKADHKWCLSGTPLQNRIGELFSLVRFLEIRPFAGYVCKACPCSPMNWTMQGGRCTGCNHGSSQHVSVFNQELLIPIQKFGSKGKGAEAFRKLGLLTSRFMLRRVKRDHAAAMELPAKEICVDRQFFGEEENDFAGSIMNQGTRKFETYVAQGVLLNNYANIFGLIMHMRQVADHPDLILKRNGEGGQNVLVCCICDETAEEAIRSACKHDFCRECATSYLASADTPDCPQCHIALAIDLEQPDLEQDEQQVKKSSIINRIKMENWTSSSKIETLVHDLHALRSPNMSHKSIIFSQFTTMLQLVEWRLRRAGITTVMLDGSMTPAQRQASINHFKTDIKVECFLVSLKAGGVALNLTEASKVFIVDPWWNPAAEWQSADRCHRIGQGRPCQITRLCIEDSVESRMVLLQEKKANMINSTINSDQKAMENLTPQDLQFLFRGS
ncbi:DNA repair protein RAD16 [Diplocarpon rosae]|nr:DNA repair protein RAD16 [Diplocarpon rosae]